MLKNGIEAREVKVEAWLRNCFVGEIEAGISSCISRNSDSLGLPFPTEYLPAQAFQQYLTWLQAAGLTVDVAVSAHGAEYSLLLRSPTTH